MDQTVTDIHSQIEKLLKRVAQYQAHWEMMGKLIDQGEARRLGRTSNIVLKNVRYQGGKITAEALGSKGDTYQVRINLSPPGHHCTCPDWQQRGKVQGPCKHVLRLAEFWRDEKILPQVEKLSGGLQNLLS